MVIIPLDYTCSENNELLSHRIIAGERRLNCYIGAFPIKQTG